MNEIYKPTLEQQLQMLREQTRLTGALHEAQVTQLKLWPLVLFEQASGSEFTWDPEKKTVSFEVRLAAKSKYPTAQQWEERGETLNLWVQTLLGDDWCIVLRAGKPKTPAHSRRVFRGARKIEARKGNVSSNRDPDTGGEGGPAH